MFTLSWNKNAFPHFAVKLHCGEKFKVWALLKWAVPLAFKIIGSVFWYTVLAVNESVTHFRIVFQNLPCFSLLPVPRLSRTSLTWMRFCQRQPCWSSTATRLTASNDLSKMWVSLLTHFASMITYLTFFLCVGSHLRLFPEITKVACLLQHLLGPSVIKSGPEGGWDFLRTLICLWPETDGHVHN